ncbi:MAG: hypothetical protein ACRDT0_01755 [Pseudonocardiaceae bacterium]
MVIDWARQLIPVLITAIVALVGLTRGQGRLRNNLRHDAETLKELPADSTAWSKLMTHVEWQVRILHDRESTGTRDWSAATLGVILATGCGYATFALFDSDQWWKWFSLPTFFLAIVGLVGMFDSLALKERPQRRGTN